MRSAASGIQDLFETHSTFTLNVELYDLTVLALREIYSRRPTPAPGAGYGNADLELQHEAWNLPVSRVAMTRAEVNPRSYIGIALVADTTRTR